MLKARGYAITNCMWDKMRASDESINNLIMNEDGTVNDEKYDNLTRPVTAFITFNSDDGLNEALLYNKQDAFYRDSNNENSE
jgi:hypothetical protein